MTDPPRRDPALTALAAALVALTAITAGVIIAEVFHPDHTPDTTWRVPDPSPYSSPPIPRGATSGGTR